MSTLWATIQLATSRVVNIVVVPLQTIHQRIHLAASGEVVTVEFPRIHPLDQPVTSKLGGVTRDPEPKRVLRGTHPAYTKRVDRCVGGTPILL